MATQKFLIQTAGEWTLVAEGPDVHLVTGNDNWTYGYFETAPTDTEIDGHPVFAGVAVRAAPLTGESFFVRALRPMRLSITPEE